MKIKQVLIVFIVLALTVTFVLAAEYESAFAADAGTATVVHSGKSGDIKWSIDSSGLLTVSGTGDFERSNIGHFIYDKDGFEIFSQENVYGWEAYADKITEAHVKVKGCTSFYSLFAGMENLKNVDFSGSDTSSVTDFRYCFGAGGWYEEDGTEHVISNSLETLDLTGLDTSGAIDMACMFTNSNNLKKVDITGWDTSNVTNFEAMFNMCHKLQRIEGIEGLDVRNVKQIDLMFQQNYELEKLDLSRWSTINMENIWSAFSECYKLTGSLRILYEIIDYSNAFGCNTFCDSSGTFKLLYNENVFNRDYIDKIAATAGSYSNCINIAALDECQSHTMGRRIRTKSTCTEPGQTDRVCLSCGYYETAEEPAGHVWDEGRVELEPTCTDKGIFRYYCKKDPDHWKDESIPATGHKWDSGKVTKKATTASTGVKTYTCMVCEMTKTEAIAKLAKKANTLKIKVAKKTYKAKDLKKAKKTFSIGVSKARGKVTYKLNTKARKAKIKVSEKGKVTVPKKCKKGTYKITVKAAGNSMYKAGSKTVTITVK